MRNYSNQKNTLAVQIPEETPYIKMKDLFPKEKTFEKGDVPILGYIKHKSDRYDGMSYALLVNVKGEMYFMNVPSWYGDQLDADFNESEQTAAEFFDNAFIKEIEIRPTKKGNDTFNVIIFED